MSGKIFVISGPSGVGKSTLISGLRKRISGLGYSISHTSRSPRANEVNGVEYHFVDRDTFQSMIKEDAFVEWATVYNDLYGTSFSSLNDIIDQGLDVFLDIDIQGAKNIKRHFKDSILVYILPPSLVMLEERLRSRASDDDKTIETRTYKAKAELNNCTSYDYFIVNDDLEKAVSELESIIVSDRCHNSRMLPKIKEMIRD